MTRQFQSPEQELPFYRMGRWISDDSVESDACSPPVSTGARSMKTNCTDIDDRPRQMRVCEMRNSVLFSICPPRDGFDPAAHRQSACAAACRAVRTGKTAPNLFTVRSGLIKLKVDLPNGTQRIVRLLRRVTWPNGNPGRRAVSPHGYRPADASLPHPARVVIQLDQTNQACTWRCCSAGNTGRSGRPFHLFALHRHGEARWHGC